MLAYLILPSRFWLIVFSQSFWIRQLSYKINLDLQVFVKQFFNIYFLTTIRFFARFLRLVYTLY